MKDKKQPAGGGNAGAKMTQQVGQAHGLKMSLTVGPAKPSTPAPKQPAKKGRY